MEFTVKRSSWSRGVKGNKLLLDNGKKCCLGFLSLACGYSEDEIREISLPYDVRDLYPTKNYYPSNLLDNQVRFAVINDDINNETEREQRLTEEFSKIGITVKFED